MSRGKVRKGHKIRNILIAIFLFFVSAGLFLLYGPWHGFRDFWITTAMSTMHHRYLATWIYSDKTINSVLEKNKVVENNEDIDMDMIEIYDDTVKSNIYKNDIDRQVLEHNEGEIYKYFKVTGYNFDAYMAVIYDPSKISVVHTKYLGSTGQYLTDMAKENNAVVAINGGAFIDINGLSNGGQINGILIEDGQIISSARNRDHGGGVIGFTNDNKLYLANVNAYQAVEDGVRDGVEFGPFLIINGKRAEIYGNGGMGIHPRTAIGQRQDGVVLFLVVDGRRIDSMGASIKDLIDIMEQYGAYNAANLDGGNSSVLVINNKIMNRPINWDNLEQTRPIASGFIVTE
ncbi:MAG: phosphodiester glycosidase family protein [Bacilli bacterium]|nr:phosphodiester glycosidase family protein [Bacilli bacterium]